MLNVIYVPGLGDKRPYGQVLITKCWRLFGLRAYYLALDWANDEPFESKLTRLVAKIDELAKDGPVSLVGVSAGAGAVLNAYALRPNIKSVVLICGKVQHPETINPSYFERNPAFKSSAFMVAGSLAKLSNLQRARIMSIRPLSDQTVPPNHTIVPGAVAKVVGSHGHIQSIYYTIIFKPKLIASFLKSQTEV